MARLTFMRYVYRGDEEGERIPDEATHIFVDKDCTVILERAFFRHPNIEELICHDKVVKIEEFAFNNCPNLRRVIMPGVKIVDMMAFQMCPALTDVECSMLEIIREEAFLECFSLKSIDLSSASIVGQCAFHHCRALVHVKFGNKLERIEEETFFGCTSLERITIPLKDGIISAENIFTGCDNLKQVDLNKGALEETMSLYLEKWRDNVNEEIDSINETLLYTEAGDYEKTGGKARVIRRWIRAVLFKTVHYNAEHQRILEEEILPTLQLSLHRDIVTNKILRFLQLPSHTFELKE